MDKETNYLATSMNSVAGIQGTKGEPGDYTKGSFPLFHDYQYLNLLRWTQEGRHKGDRTGTGTTARFGYQMRFDIRNGIIPLLTTKKMYMPAIIHEIIWYLSGDSNIKYLLDNKVRIWSEWATPEGHLNKVYGHQWRKWETVTNTNVVLVKIREGGIDAPYVTAYNFISSLESPDDLEGKSFINKADQKYYVWRKLPSEGSGNSSYEVWFPTTGSIVKALRPNIKRGQVSDPYAKTVFGEGCVGEYVEHTPIRKVAYNLWYNMMRRCYDQTLPEYALYGGKGVFVDQSWRCFANFLRDIHSVVGFGKWAEAPSQYQLDKDYFLGNCYSKDTTIFIPNKYNQQLVNATGCKYVATHQKTGATEAFTIIRDFATKHGIYGQQVSHAILHSPNNYARGWSFEKIEPPTGYVYRQEYFVDQIANLLHDLKTNPDSRRLMVSAWNVADIADMKLPPCHFTFQFYSEEMTTKERMDYFVAKNPHLEFAALSEIFDGQDQEEQLDMLSVPKRFLSCMMSQRSADVFLGVPFNIAQYSILTHIFAKLTGMAPKEFIWSGGDCHIYDNLKEQVAEQLTRIPYPSPRIVIKDTVDNIDNLSYNDFEVIDYQFHPAIKGQVAI